MHVQSLGIASLLLLSGSARAGEQVYRTVTVEELGLDSSELAATAIAPWPPGGQLLPYVALETPGEAYLETPLDWGAARWSPRVCVMAPGTAEVRGTLVVPGAEGPLRHGFVLSAPAVQPSDAARVEFLRAKHSHHAWRFRLGLPGAAWFRYQADLAERELRELGIEVAAPQADRTWIGPRRRNDLEDSYDLFTGGRALAENLQLDRALEPAEGGAEWVALDDIQGVTTREMDWSALTEGIDPKLDPLARRVPFDQHAVFFPSFGAMVRAVDEGLANGAPVLELFEASSEDARSRERYERQLCLALDAAARLLGDKVVAGVAITGSDPYLRTGSDVAVLLEARSMPPLVAFLRARQAQAVANDGALEVEGEIAGRAYFGAQSPDRRVASLAAVLDETLVVTNSLEQLELLVDVHAGRRAPLASLDEYRFFRERYTLGDATEACFLVLSDATIRRWCSPRWRIGAARRTRAAAVMAAEQARLVAFLADERRVERTLVTEDLGVPGGGRLWRGPDGVESEVYGTPEFLTPIVELEIERVTAREREAYERFRDRYQSNWRRWFDPIAARLTVEREELGIDVTVMPLIEGTDYRELIELTRGVRFAPGAGDPHAEAILHYVMAIDPDSERLRWFGDFLGGMAPNLANPLAWIGDSVAFYVDRDPVWQEMAASEDPQHFPEKNLARLPIGVHVESKDALRLGAFMATLRTLVDTSAPGLVRWETREHDAQPYVAVLMQSEDFDELEGVALFYATLSDGLMLSLREDVLQRALERRKARRAEQPIEEPGPGPWLGESVAVHADAELTQLFLGMWGRDHERELRELSWRALPILSEWKRLFPDEDPIAFHAQHFGVRLLCPGSGEYRWNAGWGTMESSAYGHPGEVREGPSVPPSLARVRGADLGVTFEEDGLRARARIEREAR